MAYPLRLRASRRASAVRSFEVMEVMGRARALAAAGRDVIHLEVGEPDFPTPAPMIEAALRAARAGHTHYTLAGGLPELRARIAALYAERYGVALDPACVVVTPGGSGALQLAVFALLEPDDEVLLPDPGYPCNAVFVRLAGAVAVRVPVGPETGYQPTPAQLEAARTPRTRAVILASPANPTGAVIGAERMAALAAWARGAGVVVIADEIYHGLAYTPDVPSALAHDPDALVVGSFSKYFGMTGWRLGWLVVPQALGGVVERLAQNLYIAPPTPAQYAALAAFEPPAAAELAARRAEFQTRRDLVVPALRDLGFDVPVPPDGAFYVYAGCGNLGTDSPALCARLLGEAGVALTPGTDFGEHGASAHLRLAYTQPRARLEEALARLQAVLG
jgi:aspartate/methionine/tyrosine aminotransferase